MRRLVPQINASTHLHYVNSLVKNTRILSGYFLTHSSKMQTKWSVFSCCLWMLLCVKHYRRRFSTAPSHGVSVFWPTVLSLLSTTARYLLFWEGMENGALEVHFRQQNLSRSLSLSLYPLTLSSSFCSSFTAQTFLLSSPSPYQSESGRKQRAKRVNWTAD